MNDAIVHVANEVAPYSKRGGLGDVVGSLPKALARGTGAANLVFTPLYAADRLGKTLAQEIEIEYMHATYQGWMHRLTGPDGVIHYFVEFRGIYSFNETSQNYPRPYQVEADLRYFLFAKAVLHFLRGQKSRIRAIITHDWHAGAIYPYLRALYPRQAIKTIHIIHNYHYQGELFPDIFPLLESEPRSILEGIYNQYGYCNMQSLAVELADRLMTVSAQYAEELRTNRAPHCGMEIVAKNAGKLSGSVNGLDYGTWDPATDPMLARTYGIGTLSRKRENKKVLLRGLHLDASGGKALAVLISRLTPQKGLDLFLDLKTGAPFEPRERMRRLLAAGLVLVICGNPDGALSRLIDRQFGALESAFPRYFRYINHYDEATAHMLYAGADMLLLPSRFEPCGLSQLIAMRYGTVPLVMKTGGLMETVTEPENGRGGNGFVMECYSFESLLEAVQRALAAYADRDGWLALAARCMAANYAWEARLEPYLTLLDPVAGGTAATADKGGGPR
ncbi:MAG: glycogen synthase [Patescibacteria group bacterium]